MIRWQLLLVIYSSLVSASYVKKNNGENDFKTIRTWELGSGKYFNIKNEFSKQMESQNSSKFPLETKEAFQDTLHVYLFGTQISLSLLREYRNLKKCVDYPTDECEYPLTVFRTETSSYSIILYDENNQPKESKFRIIFQTTNIDGLITYHMTAEISDEKNNQFLPIFKMNSRISDELPKDVWYIESPLLSTTIKLSAEYNWPNSKAEMLINNETGFVDYRSERNLHNVSLDNLFGNERVSKIRENAIKSIFLSQDVPESFKEEEQTFHFKSEKLNVFSNLTTSDISTHEKESWTLLEAESSQWPQINFVWNMLQMSQNETNWEAGFGKSSWNQATWRKNSINGTSLNTSFVFTTHFNSGFPIASAVFKVYVQSATAVLILDSQESQYILKFKSFGLGACITLSRTDIWTQNVTSITLLEINDIYLGSSESNEQTSKLVISHYKNFKSFVETICDSLSKVDKLLHALWKDRLLAKVLDVLAVALGGTLREDLMKEVDHLEFVLKETLTVVSKDYLNLVEEKFEKIKDILIKSLRSIGGDYIEEDDQIAILHNKDLLYQKLPSIISKELLALLEKL